MTLLEYFPEELGTPRPQQTEALEFTQGCFDNDTRMVVIEAPVGSGKSGVAMAVSRALGGGIVACPTVQLQAQYISEFEDTAPLLGRSRFPCVLRDINAIGSIPIIQRGGIPKRPPFEYSCADGVCMNGTARKYAQINEECASHDGCPQQISLEVAQKSETIVSNLHSLMYSVSLNDKISRRSVLIIDECHGLQDFMRDFLKIKFKIRRVVRKTEIKDLNTVRQWYTWLKLPEQVRLLSTEDDQESYLGRLEKLSKIGEGVFKTWPDEKTKEMWVEFTPINVGAACRSMLFSLADKIVLMSGTIYNKELFLKPLGVNPADAAFIRIASDFPKENRPVVLPRRPTLDLSHKNWDENFDQAIIDIKELMNNHGDEKGLIQTSSYRMSREIQMALKEPRIMGHEPADFATKLKEFCSSNKPRVFISPVIAQGVDFKEDLARWQIIVRPSYATIADPYVKYLLDSGYWPRYNYMAAVVLGQQTGRIVRSKTDTGVTYLLSSTFSRLVSKSSYLLPMWQKQGFIK